jgi:two-component system sensor kinase FixL
MLTLINDWCLRTKVGKLGNTIIFVVAGAVYLASYVFFYLVGAVNHYGAFEVAIWNPGAGLSIAAVLIFGPRMMPLLFASPLLGMIASPGSMLPWQAEVILTFLVGASHAAVACCLARPALRFNYALETMRDLVLLLLAAATCATLVALSYLTLFAASGLLPPNALAPAVSRAWLGEAIGILGFAPFVLLLWRSPPVQLSRAELVVDYFAIVVGALIVFGTYAERQFQLFYVLFVPIVLMAVRGGIEVVSGGISLLQLNIFLGLALMSRGPGESIVYQTMVLVLTLTGLATGALVTEGRRIETQLRLHRESLARLGRLGSAGELAAAIAHEVNQPLAAASTYMRFASEATRSGRHELASVEEATVKAASEVERATEIIRRLRALIRLDRTERETCSLHKLVRTAIKLCQPAAHASNVDLRLSLPSNAPSVSVDVLQAQQVFLNILRNSIEAIDQSGRGGGTVKVTAGPAKEGFVEIVVDDTGPGFPDEFTSDALLPLTSTKSGGLGIGLRLSRSIVEAHGGRLWLDTAASAGASVHFTLPVAEAAND